ncbi:hypothetical protein AB4342_01300 [Vibrio breoganii]
MLEYRAARAKAKSRDWARCYYQSLPQIAEKTDIPQSTLEKNTVMTSLVSKGYLFSFRQWNGANWQVPIDKGDRAYDATVKQLTQLSDKLAMLKKLRGKKRAEAEIALETEATSMLHKKDITDAQSTRQSNTSDTRELERRPEPDNTDNNVIDLGANREPSEPPRDASTDREPEPIRTDEPERESIVINVADFTAGFVKEAEMRANGTWVAGVHKLVIGK